MKKSTVCIVALPTSNATAPIGPGDNVGIVYIVTERISGVGHPRIASIGSDSGLCTGTASENLPA